MSGLRRKAADLAYSGKHGDAARIYEQILESPHRDGETALRLGALRRKLGDVAGARASFQLAAELFRMTGHFRKADAAERVGAGLAHRIGLDARPRGWRAVLELGRRTFLQRVRRANSRTTAIPR